MFCMAEIFIKNNVVWRWWDEWPTRNDEVMVGWWFRIFNVIALAASAHRLWNTWPAEQGILSELLVPGSYPPAATGTKFEGSKPGHRVEGACFDVIFWMGGFRSICLRILRLAHYHTNHLLNGFVIRVASVPKLFTKIHVDSQFYLKFQVALADKSVWLGYVYKSITPLTNQFPSGMIL